MSERAFQKHKKTIATVAAVILAIAGYLGYEVGPFEQMLKGDDVTKEPVEPVAESASSTPEPSTPQAASTPYHRQGQAALPDGGIGVLYEGRYVECMVEAQGVIQRILPDDNDGSRHQRWIVELATGATVLLVHNIDLAPRVPVEEGDRIAFAGEYEWNDRGGVVHWTHHNPDGMRVKFDVVWDDGAARPRRVSNPPWEPHPGGWIEHRGQRYE